jgi:hypothetical protein
MPATRTRMPDRIGSTFDPPRGTAVLNGLSVVNVPCPSVTANSIILHDILIPGGVIGVVQTVSRTPGVGFGVLTVALGTSTIGWVCMEP